MKNKKRIYLDYAATHPLSKKLISRLNSLSCVWYNPSSVYEVGAYNKEIIENVRNKVAAEINAEPEEIIFVSSGSEANALAIDGFLKENDKYDKCYCSNIEHASILNNPLCKPSLKVDNDGVVYGDEITEDGFYSVMMCNNEIGTYQPIKEISNKVHELGGVIHVDAVQAFGKIPIDVKYLDVDMMSISGHKIGAIRGVGVLYVKKGIKISPIIYGTQEGGLRGGTYNDLAIKTLGLAMEEINYDEEMVVRSRRDYLLKLLYEISGVGLNGGMETRNGSNVNIRISNLRINSQQLVAILDDMYNIQLSAGSACHSYEDKPSHVLKAIGLSDEQAKSSIRITIGIDTSVQDILDFVDALKEIIEKYRA